MPINLGRLEVANGRRVRRGRREKRRS